MERTLVILKPDCFQRGLIGEAIQRFERRGLKVVAMKLEKLSNEKLEEHYAHVAHLPFFPEMRAYMQSTPVLVMVLEGPNAVECVRQTAGIEATDIGSFRGDYSGFVTKGCLKKNMIHTSDSVENAKEEIARFLDPEDIMEWKSVLLPEMFSPKEWGEK